MWEQVVGEWDVYRLRARARWPNVPADRIDATGGDRGGLIALLERHGQRTREQAEADVDAWAQAADDAPVTEGDRPPTSLPAPVDAPRHEADLREALASGTADRDEVRERLLMRWPQFRGIDRGVIEGGRDAILTALEARLGYAKANAEADLDMVLAGHVIEPRDVYDEEHHPTPSGPVPPSGASQREGASNRSEGGDRR